MVLRLAWVTPFGPRSDVGAFSRNILDAARRDHAARVRIIPVIQRNGPAYFAEGPALTLDDHFDPAVLEAFDHPVYNLGNNAENHGRVTRLALARPGVVVLHDVVMHPTLAFEAFEVARDASAYAALLAAEHGVPGLDAVAASGVLARPSRAAFLPWESAHAADLPLIGPFVASAAAVVVHSAFAAARIRPLTTAPVLTLGIPHDQKPSLSEAELAAWAEATCRAERPLAVAFGHIARAKCLDLVLRAMALAPPSLRLLIAGRPVEPGLPAELEALAAQLGLAGRVTLETDVTVARLQAIKREADIFVNIRHPNTESASGSLAEMLDAGKPVILHPAGAYAEVPEAAALRIASVSDPAELAAALAALAADPERRVALGAAGQAEARRWSGGGYVARLLDFLDAEGPAIRRRQGVHAARRAGTLAALAALDPADHAFARGAAWARLFAGPLLAHARAPDAAPFLALPVPELRGLIVAGLLGQAENPWAILAAEALLATGDRPAAYRAVAQTLALRAFAEGGPPPGAALLDAAEPAALPLLAAISPAALSAGLVAYVWGRLPSRAELTGTLGPGERAAGAALRLLDSDAARRRGLPEAERRALAAICAGLSAPWEAGIPEAPLLTAEAPLLPGRGLDAALRGPWGAMGVDGAPALGTACGLALRLPPAGGVARRIGLDLRLDPHGLATQPVGGEPTGPGADRPSAVVVAPGMSRPAGPPHADTGPAPSRGPGSSGPPIMTPGLAADDPEPGRQGHAPVTLDAWAGAHRLPSIMLGPGADTRAELTLPATLRPEDGVLILLDGWVGGLPPGALRLSGATLLGEGEAAPPPLLPPGVRVAVTPADPLAAALLAGPWYGLEAGGAWSRGPAARIVARLPEGAWRLGLDLRVEGIAAQGPKRVTAAAAGRPLAEALFTDTATQRLTVPLADAPLGAGRVLRLDLDCGAAANLAALGLGGDTRELGLMLVALTLEPAA
jgi:glycosyltransferase involved in cell wall biosynthesis